MIARTLKKTVKMDIKIQKHLCHKLWSRGEPLEMASKEFHGEMPLQITQNADDDDDGK